MESNPTYYSQTIDVRENNVAHYIYTSNLSRHSLFLSSYTNKLEYEISRSTT